MAITSYAGAADYAGGTMRVRIHDQLDLATIYADPLLTPKANPFVTDANNGAYVFWADDAETYDIENVPQPDEE